MPDPQIQIPLQGGPNETVDPRQLPPGSVISVRNAIYDADGTYQPRLGYVQLLGATNNPAGIRSLYTRGTELLANDATKLWSWDSQAGNWVSKDNVLDWTVSHRPLQNATSSYQSWSSATFQQYRVIAWVDNQDTTPRVSVYDMATGACVFGPVSTGENGAFNVQVLVVSSVAIILYSRRPATTTHLRVATLALSPLGTVLGGPSPADGGDVLVTPVFAANNIVSTTNFVVAYEVVVSGAQSKVQLRSFDQTVTAVASSSFTLTSGTNTFSSMALVANSGENLWVAIGAFASAYTTKGLIIRFDPSTLVQSAGPFAMAQSTATTHAASFGNAVSCSIERLSSTVCLAAFSVEVAPANNPTPGFGIPQQAVEWQSFNTSGAIGTPNGATGCVLASQLKFDATSGNALAVVTTPAGLFKFLWRQMVAGSPSQTLQTFYQPGGSYAMVGLPAASSSSADYQAGFAPQIAAVPVAAFNPANLVIGMRSLPALVPQGSGYEFTSTIARNTGRNGLEVFDVFRGGTAQRVACNLGQEMYFGGLYYDGNQLQENGYLTPPQTQQGMAADQSGSPTRTYQYVLTFARYTTQGSLEESAPSAPITEVSAANCNIQLTISTLHLTRKQRLPRDANTPGLANPVYILVYRTQALENGDTTLYLQSVLPYPTANQNTLSADQIVITDTTTDLVLSSQPPLYTVGGELQHDQPDHLHGCVTHFNRVWGIGSDNRSIWFTQAYSPGQLPAWSLLFLLSIDEANEDIIALGSLQDKVVAFTRKRAYVLFGDGPSNADTGAEWELPFRRIPAVSGCIDARSVVQTPLGLMHQSERGLELISPNLEAVFIGLPVSVTTASFPICSSASFAGNSSTVRFCFGTNDVPVNQQGGALVVYDLRRQRWTTHYLTAGGAAGNQAGAPCYASTYHTTLGFVEGHNLDQYGNTGVAIISREAIATDAAPWADYGQFFVPLQVVLSWIKSGDLQGWQRARRVRVLADFHDAHGLAMTVDYDYQTVGESHTRTSNVIAGIVSGSWEQVRFIPGRGKSQAIRLTLATTAPTSPQVLGSGRGAGLVGVSFEIKPAKGGYRPFSVAAKG